MPNWMKNPQWWIVILLVFIAASSSYSSYKIYEMTDGKKAVPTKKR
jgi:hypothetical protein